MNLQNEMRSDPIKWGGIAAAAGFGLGLLGRYLRYRAKVKKRPAFYIIEDAK